MQRKDSVLKIRISGDLKAQVEMLADQMGETVSVIAREALRRYVDAKLQLQTGSKEGPNPVLYMGKEEPGLRVAEPPSPFSRPIDAPPAMPGDYTRIGR